MVDARYNGNFFLLIQHFNCKIFLVIESVFSLPGIGRLIIGAILRRDIPVIQGGLLLTASAFVFVNIIVDILYAYLDPRVRYEHS